MFKFFFNYNLHIFEFIIILKRNIPSEHFAEKKSNVGPVYFMSLELCEFLRFLWAEWSNTKEGTPQNVGPQLRSSKRLIFTYKLYLTI